ncbi:MAG TPA: anti-sigma factor [Longimicrobium sp.]|nr:anti-sigma factor [Longimicrobium sp.]
MSLDMTHEDVQAALAAEALGALDGEEAAAIHAHLAACDECRRELARLEEAAAALAWAAPRVPMDAARSARMRARLLARAAADRGADSHTRPPRIDAVPVTPPTPAASRAADVDGEGVIPISRAPSRRGGNAGWLAAAAALLLAIAVGAWAARLKGRYDALGEQYAQVDTERGELLRGIARRDSTLAALSTPGVRVIDMASTQQKAPGGRMFWDPRRAKWIFFAHDLPRLRAGRDYQMWLITADGPISAGTFKPHDDGTAEMEATFQLPPDGLRAVAVTDEPEGGLPKPSTTPIILGTFGESAE